MGQYESQRAIAARTISERRRGRKPPLRWRAWFLTRFGALTLTIAAIVAGACLSPLARSAPMGAVVETAPPEFEVPKLPLTVKLADAISPGAPQELTAISQAR